MGLYAVTITSGSSSGCGSSAGRPAGGGQRHLLAARALTMRLGSHPDVIFLGGGEGKGCVSKLDGKREGF
jgi:hypothetical protein